MRTSCKSRSLSGNSCGLLVIAAILVANLAGPVGAATQGDSIEDFLASLDSRVFQVGGYGPWPEPLGPIFDNAVSSYDIPRELLLTLGYMGSAFENRGDQPTIEYGYGVMALRQNSWGGNSLAAAAQMLGHALNEMKTDPRWNILGAAAVLDLYATEENIDRSAGWDAWRPVVVRYAGLDPESSEVFAQEVFSHLADGIDATNSQGERFSFSGQAVTQSPLRVVSEGYEPMSPDYPPAVWDPAPTCNYTAVWESKDTIIVHTVEGSYAGCISWIKNCDSNVSAHYVIAYDGRITQMVREYHRAWHVSCYNYRSIGFEHEGYASSPSHPQSQYDASGDLARDICDAWGIPKAKRTVGPGILGHIDVTNCCCGTHTDPGAGWDWTYYIARVNGTPPTPDWAASYVNQSYPSSMTAGETAVVWAEFLNDGTGHWRHAETRLGTSSPQDRTSPFCTSYNWVGCNRPTDVDQSDVAQGQVGRFSFILTAPAAPGTYVEKYKLVREGITWFGPEITWTITVTASQGNLNGTVTNASTGSAIAGATVSLSGVGSTTTNSSGAYAFNNVTAGSYPISVSATGFNTANDTVSINAGETTTKNFALTPSDTQAPSTPTDLTATATGPTTVQLTWTASTDNVGVAGYDIRRNGATIGSSTGPAYTDSSANPNSNYTYEVRARDSVPNYSGWSNSAAVSTPPVVTTVFTDGFDGGVGNWIQQTEAFEYNTDVNHNSYTGAGAAYCGAGQADQMYHPFARPFAQGKVWGWFYDTKGGWKAGICGWYYRQALSLRDPDGAAKMFIDNEFYSASDNSKYFFRTVGGGGIGHTPYATRNPNTSCDAAWVYFETTVNPGAPGASPTGTFVALVTDGAGTTSTTQNLTTDFFSYGIGRITLGLGYSSHDACYWDDIRFEATPPCAPAMADPTVLSSLEIRWNFAAADNNVFGFDVADAGGTTVSPQYPNSGWLNRAAVSWTETGLAANTLYTRKIRAWNGTLNSAFSLNASAYTLSAVPTLASVVPSESEVCAGQGVTWTAVGGFGAGKVQYYTYAWDQNPDHTFDGSEPVWSAGTIAVPASAPGTWYLHVQGFNAADVANGTYSYGVTAAPTTAVTQPPANATVCPGTNTSFSVTAVGGSLAYQWQKNGEDITDNGHYSGTQSATLGITGVTADDVAVYRCIVTGTCGEVISLEADLTLLTATTILQQPQPATECSGTPVTLSVQAVGDEPLSYQWQKNGSDIPGAIYDALLFTPATPANNGNYRCVVTGTCGSVTSDEVAVTVAATVAADFDGDCDVDDDDYDAFETCASGPGVPLEAGCEAKDLDLDSDIDQADFSLFQRCVSGSEMPIDPACAP